MRQCWSSAFRLSGRRLLEQTEASHLPYRSGCLSHARAFLPENRDELEQRVGTVTKRSIHARWVCGNACLKILHVRGYEEELAPASDSRGEGKWVPMLSTGSPATNSAGNASSTPCLPPACNKPESKKSSPTMSGTSKSSDVLRSSPSGNLPTALPHTSSWSSPRNPKTGREPDRFCDAFISIHGEICAIETGKSDRTDNPLHNAPHTATSLLATDWPHPYNRESAAYPDPVPRPRLPPPQILAPRRPHRQRPRRQKPHLHLRLRGGLCECVTFFESSH